MFLSVHIMKPQHEKKKTPTNFPPLFVPSNNSQIDSDDDNVIYNSSVLTWHGLLWCLFVDWPPAASSSDDDPLSQIKV